MLKVIGNDIKITRGDTGVVHVSILEKRVPKTLYEIQENDKVLLTVREAPKSFDPNETFLIQCEMDNESCDITIEPNQTAPIGYGTYYYDIQLTINEEIVNTIVKGKFIITDEFT